MSSDAPEFASGASRGLHSGHKPLGLLSLRAVGRRPWRARPSCALAWTTCTAAARSARRKPRRESVARRVSHTRRPVPKGGRAESRRRPERGPIPNAAPASMIVCGQLRSARGDRRGPGRRVRRPRGRAWAVTLPAGECHGGRSAPAAGRRPARAASGANALHRTGRTACDRPDVQLVRNPPVCLPGNIARCGPARVREGVHVCGMEKQGIPAST